MQVRYQYRCDTEYFRAVIARQYRQGPWLLRLPVQFSALGLVGAAILTTSVTDSMVERVVLFAVIFSLVVTVGVWGTRQALMTKFRGKPDFGVEVAVSLSDAGVEVGGSRSWSKLEWSIYPNAVRFNDGILLKRPRSIRWLPDSAIVVGSAAEATALAASKTRLRYVR
jgi:hypothetical protein